MLTYLIAALLVLTATANDVDPVSYPELAPAALLPAIIADLKRTVPDAYSIRDFLICPARSVHRKDDRPDHWYVTFAFNARNEHGGYSGLTPYTVGFKDGRISLHAFTSKLPGSDALDGLINKVAINRVLKCEPVADATIQALLAQPLGR